MRYENMTVGNYYEVIRLVGSYGPALRLHNGPGLPPEVGMVLECTAIQTGYNKYTVLRLCTDNNETPTHYQCNHHGVLVETDKTTRSFGDRDKEARSLNSSIFSLEKQISAHKRELNKKQKELSERTLRLESLNKYESDAEALVDVLKNVNTKNISQADVTQLLKKVGISIA